MKIFLVVLAVLFVLLFSKVHIGAETQLDGFKAKVRLKVNFLFVFRINYNSENKRSAKPKKEKKKRKMTLADIKNITGKVLRAAPVIAKFIPKMLNVTYLETDVLIALPDPMNTGLAYSAVMSAANIFYKSVGAGKCFLDVNYDFESDEGFKLKNKCKLYVRPISAFVLIIKLKNAGVF